MIYSLTGSEKEEAQLKLDSMITGYAVDKYNALKQGTAYSAYIDNAALKQSALDTMGFTSSGMSALTETTGSVTYVVNRPEVTVLSGGQFGVRVDYTVEVPFEVFGNRIATISIPIHIVSKFTEK